MRSLFVFLVLILACFRASWAAAPECGEPVPAATPAYSAAAALDAGRTAVIDASLLTLPVADVYLEDDEFPQIVDLIDAPEWTHVEVAGQSCSASVPASSSSLFIACDGGDYLMAQWRARLTAVRGHLRTVAEQGSLPVQVFRLFRPPMAA